MWDVRNFTCTCKQIFYMMRISRVWIFRLWFSHKSVGIFFCQATTNTLKLWNNETVTQWLFLVLRYNFKSLAEYTNTYTYHYSQLVEYKRRSKLLSKKIYLTFKNINYRVLSKYAFQAPCWNRLLSASQLRLWHPSYGGRRREDTNRGCSAVERFYSDKLDGPPLFMFMEAIFLCVMVQKPKIVEKEWELYLQYKHGQTFWTNMWDITRLT